MERTLPFMTPTKPLTEFYRQNSTGGYHLSCKACVKDRALRYRQENLDRVREYDRTRTTPERLQRNRNYRKDHRSESREASTTWSKQNQAKRRAHRAVQQALTLGAMKRPGTCERCGKECRPDAHHPDYSWPLSVVWVCDPCHKAIHKEIRAKTRASS